MRRRGTRRRAAWCLLAAASCLGAVAACGSDPTTDGPGEQVPERESFAFRMYDTSESSDNTEALLLEGVVDPAAGNGSATFVDDVDEAPLETIAVDGIDYLSNTRPGMDPELREEIPESGPCAGKGWMVDDMSVHLPKIMHGDPIIQVDLDRVLALIAEGEPSATVVDDHDGETTYAVGLSDDLTIAPKEPDLEASATIADMTATVDAQGRITEVQWEHRYDEYVTTTRIEMFDFGVPVEVAAPADDDVCSYTESMEHSFCRFESQDLNQPLVDAIEAGDREALRSAHAELCTYAEDVPLYVRTAGCDVAMVEFLFTELGMDPNATMSAPTALFDTTHPDRRADRNCTPAEDLALVQVLLDAGADPCIAPEVDWAFGEAPEWEAPATGITKWNVPPEMVAAVQAATENC